MDTEIRTIYRALLVSTFTKEACLRRIRIMREYLEAICFSGEDTLSFVEYAKRVGVSPQDAQTVGHAVAMLRDAHSGQGILRTVVYEVTNGLVALVEAAKTTVLYLPIPIDDEIISKIGTWVRTELDEELLMEFREDASIGIGAGISVHGRYQEYGVRYFLDQQKDKLFQIFDQVVKI